MNNEQPTRRPPRKSPNGAPMGSTVSIVVAVVAVIAGFLILRNVTNDSTSTSPGGDTSTTVNTDSSIESTTTLAAIDVTPTTAPIVVTGATVLVANASGITGTAGTFSKALGQVGFTMATPTNAAGAEVKLTVSKVYYLPGGEQVAASVAQSMGGVEVAPMPAVVPIKNGSAGLGTATVLVMLGSDLAGKALPILAGETTSTTTPVVTSTSGA